MLREQGTKRTVLYATAAALAASAALNLAAVWMDAPTYDPWGKLMATSSYAVLALAAIGLMSLARLGVDWHGRVRSATNLVVVLGLGLLLYLVWSMDGSAWVTKGISILGILAALGFVCVCIFDRLGRLGGGSAGER